jgi:ABC-type polysaccharide/polyol phosphate export permease
MEEVRAAIAIAKKDLKTFFRYRIGVVSQLFIPLYQGVIPGLLFGASFAVGGRVIGLEETVGTENLAGFIFMGGVMSGLIATGFWGMAMGIRNEMDAGTLEPSWLTPTHHETLLIGRALSGVLWQIVGQAVLFVIGIVFFGLRFRAEIIYAVPAMIVAVVAMVGVAYLLAAGVLLIREASFFIDTTNFLFSIASGTAFPVTILPTIFLPVAFVLPTTYAVDLLRVHAIGQRPLLDPMLEWAALLGTTALAIFVGRWAFARAVRVIRVRGTLGQY